MQQTITTTTKMMTGNIPPKPAIKAISIILFVGGYTTRGGTHEGVGIQGLEMQGMNISQFLPVYKGAQEQL